MTRRRLTALVLVGVVLVLVVGAILARAFSVDGAERSAIADLLAAEARGDAAAMVARIAGCAVRPACRRRAAVDARYLRRRGTVEILELNPSAGFSLGSTVGTARVAWRADGSLPIVQCVKVRRAGNVLRGLRIELLQISVRIRTDADCPRRY